MTILAPSFLNKTTSNWLDPVQSITGVGESISLKLSKLDIFTLGDMLLHFPYRYQDRTRITPVRYAEIGQDALIQGTIISAQESVQKRKQLIVTIEDGTGHIRLVFFHYYASMLKQFKPGSLIRCFGEVKLYRQFKSMTHPDFQWVEQNTPVDEFLTPVYATVAGISQYWLRKTIFPLLMNTQWFNHTAVWEKKLNTLFDSDLLSAIKAIHLPTPDCDKALLLEKKNKAYQRVIFEELLAHRISLAKIRAFNEQSSAVALPILANVLEQEIARLPFVLTPGQQQVLSEIKADLERSKPMLRLLQGDVGSGKTVIALLSAFIAVNNKMQVAVMAPTDVLAEQLFQQFVSFFSTLPVVVSRLTGGLKRAEKRAVNDGLKHNQIQVVVGTHALFQENVFFADLGLVIIDEQHRFGVHQRLSLHTKGHQAGTARVPHQLIMTATPIPRTLCMSYYTHLDSSQILTMPQGRKPIQTIVMSNEKRDEIIQRTYQHCQNGEQAYWVCALVEESEHFEAQAASQIYQLLSEKMPDLSIGLVHGKLKPAEKDAVMQSFYAGEKQVLVATTVIEVGVNVPNATLMVIENTERFGLAQLHQLRGRVGRGSQQSYCVLLYQAPLSFYARERVKTMRETTDGFEIAEKDLQLRGPGEVLGTRQSGVQQLKVANFARDHSLITKVNQFMAAVALSQDDEQTIMDRWFKRESEYAKV